MGIQPTDHFHGPQLHWTADVLQPAVANLFLVPNEGLPRVFGLRPSVSASMLPIVDRPLRLGETPAPFTSRSPSVATLGPSCTPNGQSGIGQKTNQRRKGSDVVIVQGCSLNRQLAGQRRRWESNPLKSCFAGSRLAVWLQRRISVLARNRT